jgi:hypothetical protein
MKQFGLILALLVLLTSCGPAPTAAPTPDLNATMSALSGTMVASTLTAQPTNTLVPTATPLPTETATLAPTETATPAPTATVDPLAPLATLDPALPGLPTPTAFTGSVVQGDLTGLGTALLQVQNLTGVKEIIVTLTGVTIPREVPLYLSYKVTGGMNITIYPGSWQVSVEIPGKRFLTSGFRQTNKDKTTLKVYLTKLVILGP